MALDPTPWFIGGGAHHSPAVARLLAYAATYGEEGIVNPGDFKVTAKTPAAGSVWIDTGAAIILNRSAGGEQQSYIGRAGTSTSINIAPTGSGGGRSDLVVLRVKDPEFSPWQAPANPVGYQYLEAFVVQGVAAGTVTAEQLNLGYSAIALARIDLPASTSAVTSGMVKDVRRLARPRSKREVFTGAPPENVDLVSETLVNFPAFNAQVVVPEWATHAVVMATVASIAVVGSGGTDFRGVWRARLGGTPGVSQDYDFDALSGNYRTTEMIVADLDVTAMQGNTQTLQLEANRTAGTGKLRTVRGTRVVWDIQFQERTV